ncbi:MFS transporter [Kitasatospora camelliae]|uniref:MFS transporter n=1 Tax=Kitasatospora camelliae TaxID=3156397 RepID=A0AAU8K4R0_9ACTN
MTTTQQVERDGRERLADGTGGAAADGGRPPGFLALLRVAGGRRYALALVVDALGGGLLRPFLLLYGVSVLGMDAGRVGLALSVGMLAGLAAIPLTGRWIDHGARSAAGAVALLTRSAGVAVLLSVDGPVGFALAAALMGIGSQSWPTTHAAIVATLAEGRTRDAALAAGRSLRNAGLGAGALLATVAVAQGTGALRALAVGTAVASLAAGGLVWSLRVRAAREPKEQRESQEPRTGAGPAPAVRVEGPDGRRMRVLSAANLPYAFCFDVLEVALPALLVTYLHASPAWASGIFVGNTLLVIGTQVGVVVWLGRRSRRSVLAGSGLLLALSYLGFWAAGALGGTAGAAALAGVAVLYTGGEILYAGSGTALVVASAPPERLGRALARWELSTGIGRAAAPAGLTALLVVGPGVLWGVLAGTTALAAVAVRRYAPRV